MRNYITGICVGLILAACWMCPSLTPPMPWWIVLCIGGVGLGITIICSWAYHFGKKAGRKEVKP